jgi:hypothetical protein
MPRIKVYIIVDYLFLEEKIKGFDEKDPLNGKTRDFLDGKVNSKEYSEFLRKNNINPNLEEVIIILFFIFVLLK